MRTRHPCNVVTAGSYCTESNIRSSNTTAPDPEQQSCDGGRVARLAQISPPNLTRLGGVNPTQSGNPVARAAADRRVLNTTDCGVGCGECLQPTAARVARLGGGNLTQSGNPVARSAAARRRVLNTTGFTSSGGGR